MMSFETGKFLVVFLARSVTIRLPLAYLRYSVSVEVDRSELTSNRRKL